MHTENQSSKPETVPKQETGEGCPAATCCRFADTPETNAHLGSHATSPDDTAMWLEIGMPRRFERERDEARAALRELFEAMLRYEGDVDGEAPSEHTRMMDRCREILFPDNAQAHTPAPPADPKP
jgi:hypothetical protein